MSMKTTQFSSVEKATSTVRLEIIFVREGGPPPPVRGRYRHSYRRRCIAYYCRKMSNTRIGPPKRWIWGVTAKQDLFPDAPLAFWKKGRARFLWQSVPPLLALLRCPPSAAACFLPALGFPSLESRYGRRKRPCSSHRGRGRFLWLVCKRCWYFELLKLLKLHQKLFPMIVPNPVSVSLLPSASMPLPLPNLTRMCPTIGSSSTRLSPWRSWLSISTRWTLMPPLKRPSIC